MHRPHPTRLPLTLLLPSLWLATVSCGDAARDAADTTRDDSPATDIPLAATTEHLYRVGALVGED